MDAVRVGEGRILADPLQLDRAGRAVAVFRNDDLSDVLVLALVIVVIVAVDEHDDVRVLLDRARLTQIGQHGALVRPLLRSTRQLRQAHDRHIELLGHDLERTGDLGDLLHAVVHMPAAHMHQL